MKNANRNAAVAAAAMVAVGLAIGTAGAASAAQAAPRITNHEQLKASILAAVAAESANPLTLSGNPAGKAAASLPGRPVGIVSASASALPGHPVGIANAATVAGIPTGKLSASPITA